MIMFGFFVKFTGLDHVVDSVDLEKDMLFVDIPNKEACVFE